MQIVQWKIATLQTNTLRESKGRRSDDSTFYTSTQRPIKNNASDTNSYSGGDTITYIVDFCGFRFFFRYTLQFSPLFHPGTPKHSQLQEFLGTLRCFGFVVNVDWAVIPWGGEGG